MSTLRLLRLQNIPIFEQLQLEEALLRVSEENWCLFNLGAPPSIVMGISANPQKVLHQESHAKNPVPVIRRFSGGGTVFTDENTLFATLVCQKEVLDVPCFPDKILQWSGKLLPKPLQLRENDYVINDQKFGGNALYIRKERWLHHMSLLWDFDLKNMASLAYPERVPKYRNSRSHGEFLCRLKEHFPSSNTLVEHMISQLEDRFTLIETSHDEAKKLLQLPHRQTTALHL